MDWYKVMEEWLEGIYAKVREQPYYKAYLKLESAIHTVDKKLFMEETCIWKTELEENLATVLTFLSSNHGIHEYSLPIICRLLQACYARGYLVGKAENIQFIVAEEQ